jgi:nicotinamide mononucleotide (NMN) deamidase PncC
MLSSVEPLVEQIHASPTEFVVSLSGGGAGMLAGLLEVPGASRTVLEAAIPYAEEALVAWLGGRPDQFCSSRTARAMSMVAFRRACQYRGPSAPVAGLACTASLATDRPKRGPHRAHLALQTASQTAFWTLHLEKETRSRADEETIVDRLLLNILAEACGLPGSLDLGLRAGETLEQSRAVAPASWQALLLGQSETALHGKPVPRPRGDAVRGVFPGEFNPLHSGHRRMAQIAEEILGVPVEFEISITNVEKPPLDYFEIDRRVRQFEGEQSVWLSRATRFVEKSRLFPGATFVVGIDTLRRIASPKYYNNDPAACQAALEAVAARGCRFLAFGRNLGTGFVSVRDLELPPVLAAICREVPAERFREDVSSTAIRRAGQW